ncbi:Membrane protein involved in the export of O-antigen and teichoic acid [Rhizobium sp. NFR07]|uniref:O-antigen translocase n=1 Tax=Rhizobium sp. NFR07 TaxID=1566262 RepID=UPI0008E059CE|nr:O-antigen translocase [Rhizobium sp. NFR07]SFA77478.1 Membrane protein involved in the export of O-antigen and teichoic acid [Rhizobium sp. NFR07]
MTLRMRPAAGQTYTQILKSTALMGGSSLVNVALGIIRNKAMAVLLGPEGVGLMGLYTSIVDMAQAVAGLGASGSGVRQIAEAAGSGDDERIAHSATALRRLSTILGLLGALSLAVLALPISSLTFGDHQHAGAIALLSLAVFFRVVAAGQTALIQGLRGVGNLARINVLTALLGTVVSIPLVYVFGAEAIVPSVVAIAAVATLATWHYSRQLYANPPPMPLTRLGEETATLLRLGVVFMASGLLTFGAAYAIRLIVLRQEGVLAAGLYQAAWAIGGLYAGFILQAMGTDFYPRLTATADDNVECNRLVNEQAEISMLLAGPGLLATLTLAPLMMSLFYSSEFGGAVDLLRWICLGMMLRIVAWPMGFIVLAKNARAIFFWTEVAATLVHVGLAWLFVSTYGTQGAGMAFFGLYVWHGVLIYLIVRRLTGFRFSAANRRHVLLFLPASGAVFVSFLVLPLWPAIAIGCLATALCGIYSLRMLLGILPPASMAVIRGWITRFA